MQLTSNLVLLATVIAYSAPAVLSLPISEVMESLVARDTQSDSLEARGAVNFDDLELTARDLIEQYYQARDVVDDFERRGLVDDIEYQAREFANYLVARAATTTPPTTPATTTPAAPAAGPDIQPTDQEFLTANTKIKALVTQILADVSKHPALAELKRDLQAELNSPVTVFIFDKASDYYGAPTAYREAQRRERRLQRIISKLNDPTGLHVDILKEKAYLQHRHDRYTVNKNLDHNLRESMIYGNPTFSNHYLQKFAIAKNQILNVLERMAANPSHPYHAQAAQHLANKAKHRQAIKDHRNAADAKELQDWRAHLEQIKKGERRDLINAAKEQAARLETIAAGNTGDNAAAYQTAFAEEQKANPDSGVIAGQTAPSPNTSAQTPKAKLRRRRF